MRTEMDSSGTLIGFERRLNEVTSSGNCQGVLVLSCDADQLPLFELNLILKTTLVPVFGGTFPSIIYGGRRFKQGTLFVGLPRPVTVLTIPQLSDESTDFDAILASRTADCKDMKTMMVFVDGSSERIGALMNSLVNAVGLEMNCLGGGAGFLSKQRRLCLFSNEGLLEDAALVAFLDLESGIGVSHGWEPIRGPFQVTESVGNIIKSLDWEPAFQVYKAAIEAHSGRSFEEEGFYGISKSYPLGITRMGIERLVRDPLRVGADNSLVCAGEVLQGVFVDILHGKADSLITAASRACALGNMAFKGSAERKVTVLMDCVSRLLFLGDRFREEIHAVHSRRQPLIGACTIGSIANGGNDYLEYLNKTAVVGVLERP